MTGKAILMSVFISIGCCGAHDSSDFDRLRERTLGKNEYELGRQVLLDDLHYGKGTLRKYLLQNILAAPNKRSLRWRRHKPPKTQGPCPGLTQIYPVPFHRTCRTTLEPCNIMPPFAGKMPVKRRTHLEDSILPPKRMGAPLVFKVEKPFDSINREEGPSKAVDSKPSNLRYLKLGVPMAHKQIVEDMPDHLWDQYAKEFLQMKRCRNECKQCYYLYEENPFATATTCLGTTPEKPKLAN